MSQLTRQMAKEYAPDGIRSNAICPGSVQTAVLDKYLSDQAEGEGPAAPWGQTDSLELGTAGGGGRFNKANACLENYVYVVLL